MPAPPHGFGRWKFEDGEIHELPDEAAVVALMVRCEHSPPYSVGTLNTQPDMHLAGVHTLPAQQCRHCASIFLYRAPEAPP